MLSQRFRPRVLAFAPIVQRQSVVAASVLPNQVVCASTESENSNPLILSSQVPKYGKANPELIRTTLDDLFSRFDSGLAALTTNIGDQLATKEPIEQVEMVLDSTERLTATINHAFSMVEHLYSVNNTPEIRQVHSEFEPQLVRLYTALGQSPELFQVWKTLNSNELDNVQSRIVRKNLQAARHAGVGLEGEAKESFNEVVQELSKLSSTFQNNVMDASAAFMTLVTDKQAMDGLPPELLRATAHTATGIADNKELMQVLQDRYPGLAIDGTSFGELLREATPEEGPWAISIAMFQPAMQTITSSVLRRSLYEDYITRASKVQTYGPQRFRDEGDNGPIVAQILELRGRQVALLDEGHRHYADLSISTKMAPSVEKVQELLDELREQASPRATEELEELRDFAKDVLQITEPINKWDVPFLSEKLKEHRYGLSEEELRAYFPFSKVKSGLFQLVSKLFNVSVVPFQPEHPDEQDEKLGLVPDGDWKWHQDAEFLKVIDNETGDCIAGFFMDSFARPGVKREGAWMAVSMTKSKLHETLPVAHLVCNQMPVPEGEESYMNWREVLTLFHELGHVLHHLLSNVTRASVSGIHGVEWDAVELPSQFMENFAYEMDTLSTMTAHRDTDEQLPMDIYKKLVASRNHMAGWQLLRQLEFAELDLTLHRDVAKSGAPRASVPEVVQRVSAKYQLLPPHPLDHTLHSFAHIFAGGYAAGYYSYLWAEVLSADAYEAFEEARLGGGEEEVCAKGMLFRNTVLANGGSVDPMELYKAFRGREPSSTALLKQRGLWSE